MSGIHSDRTDLYLDNSWHVGKGKKMNFFEQELKKICEKNEWMKNQKYVGRACYGTIGSDIKAKIEFTTLGTQEQYEGIKATILNRTEGPVDSMVFRFKDLLGIKKVSNPNFKDGIKPYIWTYQGKTEWYVYHPSEADYQKLSKTLDDYLSVFQPEMSQTETHQEEQEGGMQMHQ